jgi:hypothetical protein
VETYVDVLPQFEARSFEERKAAQVLSECSDLLIGAAVRIRDGAAASFQTTKDLITGKAELTTPEQSGELGEHDENTSAKVRKQNCRCS